MHSGRCCVVNGTDWPSGVFSGWTVAQSSSAASTACKASPPGDSADRKIGLSRKRLGWSNEEEAEDEAIAREEAAQQAPAPTKGGGKRELRGGTGSGDAPLFQMATPPEPGDARTQGGRCSCGRTGRREERKVCHAS